jgi:hypothetical protein
MSLDERDRVLHVDNDVLGQRRPRRVRAVVSEAESDDAQAQQHHHHTHGSMAVDVTTGALSISQRATPS